MIQGVGIDVVDIERSLLNIIKVCLSFIIIANNNGRSVCIDALFIIVFLASMHGCYVVVACSQLITLRMHRSLVAT